MKINICIMIIIVLFTAIIPVESLASDDVRTDLYVAFSEVKTAERDGANVTSLATELNLAASLLNAGGDANITKASAIIQNVNYEVSVYHVTGIKNQSNKLIVMVSILSIIILSVIILGLYGSKSYWALWLRIKGSWRAELK